VSENLHTETFYYDNKEAAVARNATAKLVAISRSVSVLFFNVSTPQDWLQKTSYRLLFQAPNPMKLHRLLNKHNGRRVTQTS
jgi:hypothetical protein